MQAKMDSTSYLNSIFLSRMFAERQNSSTIPSSPGPKSGAVDVRAAEELDLTLLVQWRATLQWVASNSPPAGRSSYSVLGVHQLQIGRRECKLVQPAPCPPAPAPCVAVALDHRRIAEQRAQETAQQARTRAAELQLANRNLARIAIHLNKQPTKLASGCVSRTVKCTVLRVDLHLRTLSHLAQWEGT